MPAPRPDWHDRSLEKKGLNACGAVFSIIKTTLFFHSTRVHIRCCKRSLARLAFRACGSLSGFCLLLILTPTLVIGQQSRIYSGEHSDFSRLAIDFGRPTTWETIETEAGYDIIFEPGPGPLDLSRVFERMPRLRITNVSQVDAEGRLRIQTDCACAIDVFDAGGNVIAIDVRDGPVAKIEEASAEAGFSSAPLLPAGTLVAAAMQRRAPQIALGLQVNGRPEQGSASPGQIAERVIEPAGRGAGTPRDPSSAVLSAALADDLRRAAGAGLIELAQPDRLPPPTRSDTGERVPAMSHSDVSDHEQEGRRPGPTGNPNIRLRTGADVDLSMAQRPAGRPCPPEGLFNFMEERRAPEIIAALPELRTNLVDDRGAIRADGALLLAQAYLALGFGAEADVLIDTGARSRMHAGFLESLVQIVDHGSDDAPDIWSTLETCDTSAALWALLGQADVTRSPDIELGAVQRSFFALPDHSRLRLGTGLADRLRSWGHTDAAAAIEANLATLLRPSARPVLDAQEGAVARDPIVAQGAHEQQVDALLDRIAEDMDRNRQVDPSDLDLAETLVREHSGTATGRKLADATALGLLQRGDLAGALSVLDTRIAADDDEWSRALDRGLAHAIASKDDAGLLQLALHDRNADILRLLSPSQAIDVVERLTRAGFPELALSAMAATGVSESLEADVAIARATLASGDAARALALLAGRTDADAALVRAQALHALGNFARAAAAYDAAGQVEAAESMAWLSGDAQTIAAFGNTIAQSIFSDLRAQAPQVRRESAPFAEPADIGAPFPEQDDAQNAPLDEEIVRGAEERAPIGPILPARIATEQPSLRSATDLADKSQVLREAIASLLTGRE